MEERKFRSLSLRSSIVEDVQEFIDENPDFVRDHPEFNSVAGFVYQATRDKLQQLRGAGVGCLDKLKNAEES